MKHPLHWAVVIFIIITACKIGSSAPSPTPDQSLAATNQALIVQATIQASVLETQNALLAQRPTSTNTEIPQTSPTALPKSTMTLPAPSPTPTQTLEPPTRTPTPTTPPPLPVIPTLLATGSGIANYNLTAYLPAYNIRAVGDSGEISKIDDTDPPFNRSYRIYGERWFGITQPLSIGPHKISATASIQWEVWGLGTPPFAIKGKGTGLLVDTADAGYLFLVNNIGSYNLTMAITSGAYVLDINCGQIQNNRVSNLEVVFHQIVVGNSVFDVELESGVCQLFIMTTQGSNPEWFLTLIDPMTGSLYKVEEGDTLHSISIKFAVSLEDLLSVNPGIDPAIYVGQTIVLPVTQP